jgi:hypothetical protein
MDRIKYQCRIRVIEMAALKAKKLNRSRRRNRYYITAFQTCKSL